MKIFKAIGSGCTRALRSWKGVLIIWFLLFILISLVALPMKGVMKAGFGSSMITEKFADGFNLEAFSDLGATFRSLIQYFSTGLLILIFLGIVMNAFLTGGLFNSLKEVGKKFQVSEFFRTSAKYFWSFLGITLIISAIIVMLSLFIFIIPVSFAIQSNSIPESAPYIIGGITISFSLLLTIILLLVADYARAWQAAHEKPACFKAIGFGFSRTFKKFRSSFPMMILIVTIQVIFSWLIIIITGLWRPVTGGGVFLLFIFSQVLFIVKIMLKTWRYGSVTALKEVNDPATHISENVNVNI
jgi:hypothetical protein